MSAPALRFVIYPLFAADEEATERLIEALADVMVTAHGESATDDDSLRSIIVVETTDEAVGSEEWAEELARSERAVQIILPGAANEDDDDD